MARSVIVEHGTRRYVGFSPAYPGFPLTLAGRAISENFLNSPGKIDTLCEKCRSVLFLGPKPDVMIS